MLDPNKAEYHRLRERQERDLALASRDAVVRAIHTQMADHHAALAERPQRAAAA